MTRRARMGPADRGSASVELVVLTPVLVALVLFVVYVGRAGGAVDLTRHAADVAARAASLVSRPSMTEVARSAAERDLRSNGSNCSSTSVSVAVNGTTTNGSVTVTVSCTINIGGTELLGLGRRTVSASSTEVIDRFRAGQ